MACFDPDAAKKRIAPEQRLLRCGAGPEVALSSGIRIDRTRLAEFCRKHHIHRLAFFGSVLRDDFRPDSDVDVLVDFEPGHPVGLIRMAGMALELSELLGRPVDLRTPADLSRHFRGEVLAQAEVAFEAA
ncbi:MAG: nucleotidyltransferase family protein [Deltaproteobacteria bacterium]|nr:nucleotidyltransferase family protein [Deltaproteobacteria bacterium]